ncbi:1-(5-phosphoribosyl)-5-[(5-phosphoribosylamino)methylideneamino]imidazole-4-carboxamide isomerase [Vallitalea okinawensis]|uniref:1-(5-phosphoribosyl)-5-[(5- phosphoribosylamino)methylideneamino]imidazole-4- carboxamide isomerase n=1 Tax=Vallitalea okinawensis TaxID=2078660 RepID=UPI000CFB3D00|nr:1-(5-phosphoribosyl)-5-[(5-phosphoribosylamino)methylideneamino]imidazole-4-carboxamide isomerase [Vallitalea okinawensis]
MILYPAIDIKDGKCVRLRQGDFNNQTIYHLEPYKAAKEWQEKGAKYLHVVDLDGALDGRFSNRKAIEEILENVTIPVQLGGGIRSIRDIEERLAVGISRVILGTVALRNSKLVKEALCLFGPEKIVVGIDGVNGYTAIDGWKNISNVPILSLARDMEKIGVKTIICTDIQRDGMLSSPNIKEITTLKNKTKMKVIASGGVSNVADLISLKEAAIDGAIIGKALYTGHIDLEVALDLVNQGDE